MLSSTRTAAVCLAAAEALVATEIQAEFTTQQREAAITYFVIKPSLKEEELQPSIEKGFEILFDDKALVCYSNATLTIL